LPAKLGSNEDLGTRSNEELGLNLNQLLTLQASNVLCGIRVVVAVACSARPEGAMACGLGIWPDVVLLVQSSDGRRHGLRLRDLGGEVMN
jgi:hypothetical protein